MRVGRDGEVKGGGGEMGRRVKIKQQMRLNLVSQKVLYIKKKL